MLRAMCAITVVRMLVIPMAMLPIRKRRGLDALPVQLAHQRLEHVISHRVFQKRLKHQKISTD